LGTILTGGFREWKLFEQLFVQIVRQGGEMGFVAGKHLSWQGSFVKADPARAIGGSGTGASPDKACRLVDLLAHAT
jgi:hypothetical protein